MKKLLVQNKWAVAGLFLGAITGYAYWYFVGCSSGICSITSKPLNSALYGSVMGFLLLSLFEKKKG